MLSTFWKHDPHSAVLGVIHGIGDLALNQIVLETAPVVLKILNSKYDLIIVDEIFSVHGMAMTKLLKQFDGTPHIVFTTSNVGGESNVAEIALGHTPILDSTHGTPLPLGPGDVYNPKKFSHRLFNVLEAVGEYLSLYFYRPFFYTGPQLLNVENFDTYEIQRTAEMNLRDSFDRIGRIVPHAEDFRSVGSHCKVPESLTGDLKDFVEDKSSKGTIYIAFGSLVNFDYCPEHIFNAIFGAIDRFHEYRVIMAMKTLKKRHLPKFNDHVKILNWAPQHAILTHPKTIAFLSHGGLKSFKEALCATTPLIFMPIIAEQGMIARTSMRMGIGQAVSKYTATEQQIVDVITEVITNPSYKIKITKLKEAFLDRIMPSLDEGAWLVNKLLSRKDKLGFRSYQRPNEDHSIMFFRREGIYLGNLTYFGLDWGVVVFGMLVLVSN
uniref:UDP-glucuronosyltransferase n=1 Tax=Panagrellus redivivus TaxID=6233 RepID=A0A7E4WE84_PANRE